MKLAFRYNLRFKAVIINHNLQSSVSGHQNEYKSIKESVFRLAFGLVSDWIKEIMNYQTYFSQPCRIALNINSKNTNKVEK